MNRSSKKERNGQNSLFVNKLVQMVENPQIEDVIGWTSTADSFNIKNISKFTEQVLPKYFKHKNLASFIRQLNMYGFKKTHHIDGENVYMHPHFRANSKAHLKKINRKIPQSREERVVLYQGNRSSNKEVQDLRVKQKNLEQMCKHYFMQNQKIMEENQKIIKKMEGQGRQREKKLQELLIALVNVSKMPQLKSQQQLYGHQTSISNYSQVQNAESDSFLSINDFINAEDYNQMNLQESR